MLTWLYPVMYVLFTLGALALGIMSYWYASTFVQSLITEKPVTDTPQV